MLLLFAATHVRAQAGNELIARINDYRGSAQTCEGKRVDAAGPLAPNPLLGRVPLSAGGDLQSALRGAGYQAAQAQAIVVSGPRSAAAALELLKSKYCRVLTSPRFADIGVAHESSVLRGGTWRLVLAQPLITADLGAWREVGDEIWRRTNAARAVARRCGDASFPAVPPLAWDDRLAAAANAHSRDMANRNYFGHSAPGGDRVDTRAKRAGYAWHSIGENIATGQGSAERAVDGWLASPGHCANLMSSKFTEMGAAYAVNRDSDSVIYWTQVFGTP